MADPLYHHTCRAVPPVRLIDRMGAALRLPQPSGYVTVLTGWRGLCIALLLAGHFVDALGPLANVGVEFFFVLSGRLMAEILIVRRQNLLLFARRRAARVLPSVWFYCAVLSGAWAVTEIFVGATGTWLSPLAAFLFMHNYVPAADAVPFLQHSWSLAVEEHSYLLLAAISLFAARDRRIAAVAAALLALLAVLNGLRLSGPYDPAGIQSVFWRSDVRVASVLISFATCLVVTGRGDRPRHRLTALIAPACTLAAMICLGLPDNYGSLGITTCSLFAALAVNTIEWSSAPFRRFLEQPAMVWLGILSFSLYLWQQPFFMVSRTGFPALPCVAATFLCALWNFKRVEWPARLYLHRRQWRSSKVQSRGQQGSAHGGLISW